MSAAQQFNIPNRHSVQAPMGPRFVSENELEFATSISKRTWQKYRLMGTGPRFYKIGSAVRYNLDEVLAFIQAGAVDPGAR